MRIIHKSAWIYVQDRKVLFLKSYDSDTFFMPGGKREEGETDEDALVREVKEELSVDLDKNSIKLAVTITALAHGQPKPTNLEMKCYWARHLGDLHISSEIEKMTWWNTNDSNKASPAGVKILDWLRENDHID